MYFRRKYIKKRLERSDRVYKLIIFFKNDEFIGGHKFAFTRLQNNKQIVEYLEFS